MTFNEIELCFFLIDIYNIVLLLRASFLDKLLQDTTFPNSALSGKYDYQTFAYGRSDFIRILRAID